MNEFVATVLAWLEMPYVKAGLIVSLSFIVAKLTDMLVSQLLVQLTKRTKTELDDRLIEIMHRPIFWSVVLLGLYFVILVLQLEASLSFALIGIVKTLAVLLWTVAGFRIANTVLTMFSRIPKRVTWLDNQTLPLFDNLAKLMILGIGSYMLLLTWDINVSAWLASAGIVGIAVGLAAKDTIANLFGGMFIMADAPYKIGDFIILDTGERGRVTQIGLRSTRILTRDDVEITMPNAIIANAKITNESGGPWEKERVRATIGVAYGSDLNQVRELLMEAAMETEHIVKTQEPRVRLREFGDSSLVFQVMGWIDEPVERGRALDELNENIYNKLNAAGIQIPFPQRDIHIRTKGDA